jgi:short-subunit dehydrogenase
MTAPESRDPQAPGAAAPLVYITGASSGIGQALALRYAQEGWRLALVARRGQAVHTWAQAQGLAFERYAVYEADVQDLDSIATNLVGVAATFQPFIQPMRRRRSGCLVGMASVAAIRGLPGHGAYCASKAGVVAYCESLRGECRQFGVRVVTLLPGYIATPLTAKNPYAMPFLMSAEAFADRAFQAIEAGTSYRVIPWQMAIVAKLWRALPDAWLDRLVAGRGRKPRRAA